MKSKVKSFNLIIETICDLEGAKFILRDVQGNPALITSDFVEVTNFVNDSVSVCVKSLQDTSTPAE